MIQIFKFNRTTDFLKYLKLKFIIILVRTPALIYFSTLTFHHSVSSKTAFSMEFLAAVLKLLDTNYK